MTDSQELKFIIDGYERDWVLVSTLNEKLIGWSWGWPKSQWYVEITLSMELAQVPEAKLWISSLLDDKRGFNFRVLNSDQDEYSWVGLKLHQVTHDNNKISVQALSKASLL